jgi:hypothetical protein
MMELRDGQCRKCLSMGYCYFPDKCGRRRVEVSAPPPPRCRCVDFMDSSKCPAHRIAAPYDTDILGDRTEMSSKSLYAAIEDAIWQAFDSEQAMPHSGVDAFVVPEFLRLLAASGYTITPVVNNERMR